VILDENLERRLYNTLERCWAGDENDARAIARFKQDVSDEPVSEEDLLKIIQWKYPTYDPTPKVKQVAPEPPSEYKQSEVNNETSPVTLTTESDADAIIAEYFPEPEPTMPKWQSDQVEIAKEYKRTHRKQQVERQLLKASMLAAVDLSMSTEFTVKSLCELFPQRGEKTIAELVVELWQEGMVKGRIDTKVTNGRKNHSTCFYIITSLGNPKTHYYLQFPADNPWFKRPKKK
jgi:hypothetical protein